MKESDLKKNIKKDLESYGFFTYATHDIMHKGVPDLYCLYGGKSYWIELKYIDKESKLSHPLTSNQSMFLTDINEHGGIGIVVIGVGKMYHAELVTEYGEKSLFSFELMSMDQVIEWMLKLKMGSAPSEVFGI
jgi:hypothetical protein